MEFKFRVKTEEGEKKVGCYPLTALFSLVFVLIVKLLRPKVIPFGMWEFWRLNASLSTVLKLSLPVFVWGAGITFLFSFLTRNKPEENRSAEEGLFKGALMSVWAGVMEEICFRWIIFYGEIAAIP